MQSIGPGELLIVLAIVLVIFGPKRLPGLGRQLGSGLRELRQSFAARERREPEPEPQSLERPADAVRDGADGRS